MALESTCSKKTLVEVSIIRPFVILLLVLLHSFTKITKGEGLTNNYNLPIVYRWFCWFISGFRIETIAMIAGYVFAYQSLELNKSYRFWPFLLKKFKRLIVPMLVFGFVYYFCFMFDSASFTFKSFIVTLLTGCRHLWFLPMLFWCFLTIWIIDHFRLSSWFTLFLFVILFCCPRPYFSFGFAGLPRFLLFVYGGYFMWTKKKYLLQISKKSIGLLFWLLYIILVYINHALIPKAKLTMDLLWNHLFFFVSRIGDLLMCCCGILALYLIVNNLVKKGYQPGQWILNENNCCYGIYIYHQFVLMFIYFYTPFVSSCNPLLVPWIGFVSAYGVSWVLTKLTLRIKIGRFLIG